jgi:hypothetical protein
MIDRSGGAVQASRLRNSGFQARGAIAPPCSPGMQGAWIRPTSCRLALAYEGGSLAALLRPSGVIESACPGVAHQRRACSRRTRRSCARWLHGIPRS